ncbi:MAG: hypothetical protein K2M57_09735, partial [Paramuribaculum sp.]|nr:hypothetical protein [Paramuribaculum sp.]
APLESVLRLLNGMITHIEIVTNGNADFDTNLNLFVVDVTEDLVFGEGLPGEITFKKGDQQQFTDELLVRVSPANAVVTADQIQIVNSKGEDMSAFVTVTDVKPFEGLLTRSIANNGLHVVSLELNKDVDTEAYTAATTTKDGNDVLFAVAIADSDKDLAEGREITSAYDVTITSEAPAPKYYLDYNVDEYPVGYIHNRFEHAEDWSSFAYAQSLVAPTAHNKVAMDKAYELGTTIANYNTTQFYNVGDFAYKTNVKNVVIATEYATADNRQGYSSRSVQLGQEIPVELTGANVNGVYGMYITLDLLRATESNGSETAAWKSYESKISGINEVVKGTKTNIVLNMDDVEAGEVIGFRVWAVNYNGTLVDPDGRAFYVQIGQAEVETDGSASFAVTANGPTSTSGKVSAADQLTGDWMNKNTYVYALFVLDPDQVGNPNITITLPGANGVAQSWYNNNGGVNYTDGVYLPRDAAKGFAPYFTDMTATINNNEMLDGVAYTGKLIITSNGTNVLQTIAVSVTKNVPTAMPAQTITAKPGQVTDGKIVGYINTDGSIDLNDIFTLKNTANLSEVLTFAKNNEVEAVNGVLAGLDKATVKVNNQDKLVINDGSFYTLTFNYTYAGVSYVGKEDENGDMQYSLKDVVIPATYQMSVNTLTNAYNLAWVVANKVSKAPKLIQGETATVPTSDIAVTSSIEAGLNTTLDKVEGLTIVSVATAGNISSYFGATVADGVITLTPKDANPVGEISGTLNITYKGADGINCTKTLAITMNKK